MIDLFLPDNAEEKEICSTILKYGKTVLESEIFKQAGYQHHHLHGTVQDHTINVCVVGVWLGRRLIRRGTQINEKDLVQAALCHDLGMVGRDSRYKDRIESWKAHPEESARVAQEILPELSDNARELILSHMWPLTGSAPSSNEAMLLNIADKYASMADWQSWLTKHRFASRIKEQLGL